MHVYPFSPFRSLATLVLLGLAPLGCARYEYDIVAPSELAQHVGTKQWVVVEQEPLQYRLMTVDNRLVMQIHNPTGDPLQLVGEKSVLVDPQGQSHPLRSQTIASSSYAKLILPPMPARVERSGPTFGFGIGIGSAGYRGRHGYGHGFGGSFYDPWYDEPRYYALIDPNDSTYWEWDHDGNVRLTLVYDRAGEAITHKFVIAREKI